MPSGPSDEERDTEAVMAASRALVAIVARSFAEADIAITLPQWRVLVVVDRYGPLSPGELARWMGVHPSNVTRACDGLAKAALLDRREDPDDRRRLVLTLTVRGERLVGTLLDYRRDAIAAVLAELSSSSRRRVARAMQEFADAAGDQPEHFTPATPHHY